MHFVRRRFGRLLWDFVEIGQNRQRTKCTEHASKKIRPSKGLELSIFQILNGSSTCDTPGSRRATGVTRPDTTPTRIHMKIPGISCDLSGPVMRDTARLSQRYPPIARYGVFGVSTWPIGCDTPSPFLSVSPLESIREVEVRYPPLKRGISAIPARYPMKTRQSACDTPLCDTLSRKGIARYGGASRTGPLSLRHVRGNNSGWFNSVRTRCIVKGEAQKSPLFSRFSGGFLLFPGLPAL